MRKEEYTADYPIDYFFNAETIPNQELVFMTYDHFETGPRAGYLKPLEFLNLLEFNYEFLKLNVTKPFFVVEHLKSIPISDELRHILMGFILKWYGGYPVDNYNQQYNTTLRMIEREFLCYDEDTPEKIVCRRDWQEYLRIKEIEKQMNESLNKNFNQILNLGSECSNTEVTITDHFENEKRDGFSRSVNTPKKKKKKTPSSSKKDEWTENFEKSIDELHRREFKEIGGVRIEFTSFNQLLKDLEYNYPLYHAPLSYYHTWKEYIKYLKIEILDNLMLLPETAKIHYLDRLRYQIKEKQSAAHTSEQDYVDLLSKYNKNKEDIIEVIDYDNKIFKVVRSDVPSFHETMEPDFFADTINIQHIFYNYHFGEVLREAISFIDEQINTRTQKNKEETKTFETPHIIDNTKKDNLALDSLLASLKYKIPYDEGPFESLNIWDNNLRAFYREVLHTLSEKLPDNKKHYLDLVRRDLEDKKENIFVTDEQYDSLLADFNFDRESVLNTYDSEDTCISALASKAIILDSSMPPGYNEYEQSIQQTFYNFHYGQTLTKALDFIEKETLSLEAGVNAKQVKNPATSDLDNLEELFLKEMYGDNFMPEIKEISNIYLFDTLKTLPLYIHKVKAPATNYFGWQNLKTNLHREVSSNLLRLSIENKKLYLLKLIIEFESWSHYYDYSEKLLDDWILKNGVHIIKAIRAQDRTKDYYNLLRKPLEYFENEKVDEQALDQIKTIRENINNFLFAQFIEYCLSFIYEFRNNIDPSSNTKQSEIGSDISFNFKSLSPAKQTYVLQLLEDLSIVHDGISIISTKKKSAIRGVAEALLDASILPALSLEKSYRLLADEIGLKISSKLDFSTTSDNFYKKTQQYINENPLK